MNELRPLHGVDLLISACRRCFVINETKIVWMTRSDGKWATVFIPGGGRARIGWRGRDKHQVTRDLTPGVLSRPPNHLHCPARGLRASRAFPSTVSEDQLQSRNCLEGWPCLALHGVPSTWGPERLWLPTCCCEHRLQEGKTLLPGTRPHSPLRVRPCPELLCVSCRAHSHHQAACGVFRSAQGRGHGGNDSRSSGLC